MSDLQITLAAMGERLSSIETELRLMREQGSPQCAVHEARIEDAIHRVGKIERAQGKQNMVAMTMSAIGVAIVLTLKFLFTSGAKP